MYIKYVPGGAQLHKCLQWLCTCVASEWIRWMMLHCVCVSDSGGIYIFCTSSARDNHCLWRRTTGKGFVSKLRRGSASTLVGTIHHRKTWLSLCIEKMAGWYQSKSPAKGAIMLSHLFWSINVVTSDTRIKRCQSTTYGGTCIWKRALPDVSAGFAHCVLQCSFNSVSPMTLKVEPALPGGKCRIIVPETQLSYFERNYHTPAITKITSPLMRYSQI